ncbi:sphingomyelin phosphodiesterase-like [Phymastichus coffea]|uniref:sphingomyelin phosphodiesterase-like n=1 Tax=Phymastichus coffea TaxID=108790 RepID=UPI00273BBBEF|nr:sphingomyelin phosphodiesterase-like [Phymastichus coffea]
MARTLNNMLLRRWLLGSLLLIFCCSNISGQSIFESCPSCKIGVNLLRSMIASGKSVKEVVSLATGVCSFFSIQTPRVCAGIMNLVGADAVEAFNQTQMTTAEICSFILPNGCPDIIDKRYDWKVTFPSKPKPAEHPTVPPPPSAPRLKVLQITDIHYDPHYLEGANAECGEPLCCRATSGVPLSPTHAAGKWGDYRKCDTPKILLENALRHIAKTHKDIDYIIWTGDIPPHDSWNQTKEGNLEIIRETIQLMDTYFKDIPIYPSIGNHESCPVDSFAPLEAPPRRNMSWLYDALDVEWRRWLPDDTSTTIRHGAYYSVLQRPGLRLISVNSNYCSKNNFWLLKNSTDPAGQLAWLIEQLDDAETKGEKVHIISHMPPGQPDCIKVWSRNYYDIINRYEATIMAQFYGHTHYDEYEVFYDTKNFKRPLNVGYIAPSITPWENVNPGYRIYYVEGDHPNTTRSIIDHETWKIDLTDANRLEYPIWYRAYTARRAYGMNSLLPKDWDNLITRMSHDEDLFETYYRNYYRDSPVRPRCDVICQKELLCNLRSGRSSDIKNLCQNL